MNNESKACDPTRVQKFLSDQLDQAENKMFEEHLEQCIACRDSLDEQSAERELWQKAQLYLRDDDGELRPLSGLSTSDSGGNEHLSVTRLLESLAPTDDPEMLGRVDGYEISGVIGCGGMGAVMKGFDRSLNRVVAIKVMAPHLATSGAARKRFAREAQAAAAITHDNVIDIYSVSEANGLPYLVMPYARGTSLQKRLDERGPLPVIEVLRIGSQIASGLAAAHEQGLVHRDIKPANILLSDGIDRLVITDFGLARAVDDATVTRTGVIAGTPQYMSPEQARGDAIDHRSDLFSLGSVLYALCTGRVPFRADSAFGILRRITDNQPQSIRDSNPEVPGWLVELIARLHAKSPDDRFQTAREVAELFQKCLVHVQTPNAPLPESLRTERPSVLGRIALLLGGAAATVATVMFVASQWGNSDDDAATANGNAKPAIVDDTGETFAQGSVDSRMSHDLSETQWVDAFSPSPSSVLEDVKQFSRQTRDSFAASESATSVAEQQRVD